MWQGLVGIRSIKNRAKTHKFCYIYFAFVMKNFVKKFVPKFLLRLYHLALACLAAFWYGYPSEKLIVIGVTGTKGKSTTANLIAQFLEMTGCRVGLTSTATMKVAEREWLSDKKMTMPGRFQLQKLLWEMVKAKCEYAIIETSSEGIEQFRSRGINYDVVLLTNLTPEHIEAHGSYEAYRAAKAKLFYQLKFSPVKKIKGNVINKKVILDSTISEYGFFSKIQAGEEWYFCLSQQRAETKNTERKIIGCVVELRADGAIFECAGKILVTHLLFEFNIKNILAAMAACMAVGISFDQLAAVVANLKPVPGRQELIEEGQPFKVMVDYTYEPTSMRALYENLNIIPHRRVIHVLGPTGGGRDKWRRPVLGEIAAQFADIVIGTTDDPHDDDPSEILDVLLAGALKVQRAGRAVEVLKILDRRQAIAEALRRAQANDLILITGKGAEQKMALAHGKYIPWDDRQVVREELRKLVAS
ncbi:hypothetical protein A3H10_02020 [Candidatus Uhrbacteria bacterium RIFCSPLOWO2_12_FULL_46_10]|uniref:UDP-N-acetylmuramyl-tripeptide synthetase n=1 Tax=Candidatus Uhrbacteria bacterium RIFCSPLOWO2_01_FULL_47_25 TaxID=1802402 RepID=A0A1F7UTI5_9BACT|nr:MAG: hypothetical protein A3D60_01520 [Candidatus Uhrbacteria bacterium RIFCSPHIGHO2_02_FULL_47_29]OGL76252.1 MAG: hypothetical protein A3E96_04050 [Candidatus Uhrbacteria bacterium RIFCSPHIGHO2_12_FULL_46_13]OGL81620.1 MAG: hypothetical protein A2936_04510 [Candidatus Uhrbacteria bacterium RIFCSPLOWO2_01_FULL_47_25]OGL91268.1 MAG: hypothetical protein A3H10_02020 [Candidatus Uhrbacteria bacterium RIFCSPLOWO2_12_FULL_46_10]